MTLNSASSISIGSQNIGEKEEAKQVGRYNRLTRGYCSGRFLNGRQALGFAGDLIGSTRRCTIVDKSDITFETHHDSLVHLP